MRSTSLYLSLPLVKVYIGKLEGSSEKLCHQKQKQVRQCSAALHSSYWHLQGKAKSFPHDLVPNPTLDRLLPVQSPASFLLPSPSLSACHCLIAFQSWLLLFPCVYCVTSRSSQKQLEPLEACKDKASSTGLHCCFTAPYKRSSPSFPLRSDAKLDFACVPDVFLHFVESARNNAQLLLTKKEQIQLE